jgi:serine protease Do
MRPGDEVALRINRDGETENLTVTLGSRGNMTTASTSQSSGDTPSSPEALKEELGLELQNVTPEVARQLGIDQAQGVLITGVDQSNPMIRESGLQPKQIIFEMDGQTIENMDTFMDVYGKINPGDAFRVAVRNPNGYVFVTSLRRPNNDS